MNNFIDGQMVYYIFGGTLQQGIYSVQNNIVYGLYFINKSPEINPAECCSHTIDDVFNLIKSYKEKPKISFTNEQKDFICWQIGEWYLNWKERMTENRTSHKLGVAKEQLKSMICGNEYE